MRKEISFSRNLVSQYLTSIASLGGFIVRSHGNAKQITAMRANLPSSVSWVTHLHSIVSPSTSLSVGDVGLGEGRRGYNGKDMENGSSLSQTQVCTLSPSGL